jgi:hypothetical protein
MYSFLRALESLLSPHNKYKYKYKYKYKIFL